ncbi:MAG: 16S rRNA (cytidine(1402)-2'-O)-methyltransferase [Spirochaetaceae bacterium]|jgi:16S rRNA (cytidine1402-2'-O)-methyltransferase|nr:16S rRNA (cytidine(1402)-2'-O)-methyltransferase [Spirochaetaceae bacterium]GMO26748.1 MAG: 16S rRNA (cytidine(1402)-2'-O)-methyltransferase [Termitinemataceae bacterium]
MSTLFVVATPIGNLEDITLRAVSTLKSVSLVAAEDTRRTLALLTHLGIHVKMISCRAQNEEYAAQKIVSALDSGGNAAFVSDAGTPAISDPGAVLVQSALKAGHTVSPVPGASAFTALLSVAGARDKTVLFEGFLSPKSGRRRARIKTLLECEAGFVLYESPFRVLKLLADLADFDKTRRLCLGREMTKLHEEFLRGTVEEVLAGLSNREELRGEFALYVYGKKTGGNAGKLAEVPVDSASV